MEALTAVIAAFGAAILLTFSAAYLDKRAATRKRHEQRLQGIERLAERANIEAAIAAALKQGELPGLKDSVERQTEDELVGTRQ
jgi:hypothetical protein